MSRWTFGLCDLAGVSIGPITKAYERNLTKPLNGLSTASVRLHLNDPLVEEIFSRDGDVYLKAYDEDSILRFIGELTTAEEDALGFNRKLDREGLITEAACFPSDGSTTDVRVSSDAAAEAVRGLYQEVVPNNDVSDGQLRQALADLNVEVRKQARQIITFTAERDDDSPPSCLCTFAGPLWKLQKRWVGASLAGYSVVDPPIPASDIIAYLITQANARKDTGIRLGTIPTLYPMTVGTDSPWTYKPVAEALTNLQDSKVPSPIITPLTYEVADNLDSVSGPPGVVDGRPDLEGNTWDSNGSWNDWTAGTVGQGAGRAGFNVSPSDSRWAISSLPARAGALIAGMDFWSSIRARNGQPLYFYMYVRLSGHTAATPESGNWLRVLCGFDTTSGYYQLQKKVGATITTLGTYSVDAGAGYYWDGGTSTTWYSIRLLVDDLGNYWVYNYLSPGTIGIGFPGISGQDDDLVTGGPLDDGTYAFGDIFGNGPPTGVNVGRGFRNVFLSDLTAPQSFDFEFVPEEPTADTNQSGVVGAGLKIATLNVGSPQLGTTTNAVFEFGSGSTSTVTGPNAPRYGTDYSEGDYVIGRGKVDGVMRFNGLFRVEGVTIGVDDEGKATVAPDLIPQ